MRVPSLAALLLLLLCPSAASSGVRPAPALSAPPLGREDPSELPLRMARAALEAGRRDEALAHVRVALVASPSSPRALALAIEASGEDIDARLGWTRVAVDALTDADGELALPAELRSLRESGELPALVAVARTRAEAARELLATAERREKKARRRPQERLVAAWARGAVRTLFEHAPALSAAHADRAAPREDADDALAREVVQALRRALRSAVRSGRDGVAIDLARCLRGLGAQARFDDLLGERPRGFQDLEAEAAEALEAARARLSRDAERPWSVEELSRLLFAEGEAFTRAHDTWRRPGIALSREGRYRIETTCGYETLLGAAETIDDHHERLARWYGADPFEGRPGVVRIVPQAADLEAEGAPFWWAGGFQSGDTTTVRFSCGTIEGLGRGLTHELTHRFDGALFPGIPAWLAEGKAVWTAAAYGHSGDPEFVPNHARFGTLERAWILGYGGTSRLASLVEGTIDDYRDNYVAGYALYVYLATEERNGVRPFAARLRRFQERAARERDPRGWFEACFCDGEEGRPESFEGFAAEFERFLAGFYWKNRQPWTERYSQDAGGGGGRTVYDEPTWVWTRARAEPAFGEGQARRACELLAEEGNARAAIAAGVWALAADGRSPASEQRLAELLAAEGHDDAAWALRRLSTAGRRSWDDPPPPGVEVRALKAHLDALLAAAASARASGTCPRTAASLTAEARRVGRLLGRDVPAAEVAGANESVPLDPPAHRLGADGWIEDRLVGYEERRVPGLWFVEDDGDVHVGRGRKRTGTGRLDPRAAQRDAFVRTRERAEGGAYRVRARIRFTTSYASGALVLGFTRRDRSVRLRFSAGDFLYSIGEKDDAAELDGVDWGLSGGYERESRLPWSSPAGRFEFEAEKAAFDVELLVDGAAAHASIDGVRVGSYHTPDGAPIEGHVGFAASMGAYLVQRPTIERLDAAREVDGPDDPRFAELDPARPPRLEFAALVGHPAPGIPAAPQGTLVLWVGVPEREAGEALDLETLERRARRAVRSASRLLAREDVTQPLEIVLPACLPEETVRTWLGEQTRGFSSEVHLVRHVLDGRRPAGLEAPPDRGRTWLLLVGPGGAVRHAAPFFGVEEDLEGPLAHWLAVLRDHGRPERVLPAPPRLDPASESDRSQGD